MAGRKFWKNKIQDSLIPETYIVKRQNKLKSLGNLIGQNSHIPVQSTTSVGFEFISRKDKLCVLSRPRDMIAYILHAFWNT